MRTSSVAAYMHAVLEQTPRYGCGNEGALNALVSTIVMLEAWMDAENKLLCVSCERDDSAMSPANSK